jgi:hypothetical protein
LNQKHLLPKPVSRVVSKVLFWPTLPITVSKRIGSWITVIDDTVVMGGAPFALAKLPGKRYMDNLFISLCSLPTLLTTAGCSLYCTQKPCTKATGSEGSSIFVKNGGDPSKLVRTALLCVCKHTHNVFFLSHLWEM